MTTNKPARTVAVNVQANAACITIRDRLSDAKRKLDKAQDEVDHGANDPCVVSALIELAREDVIAAILTSIATSLTIAAEG